MKKHIVYAASKLARGLSASLLSFILFSWIFSGVPANSYLGIWSGIMLILYLGFFNLHNVEMLLKAGTGGALISLGYIAARMTSGCTVQDAFCHMSFTRKVLCASIGIEYAILIFLCIIYAIAKRRKSEKKNPDDEMFPERQDDLDRLEQYLSAADVVGINGAWGSGKTFLVNKLIEKNQGKWEVIRVEPLTCNLDGIDSYLFRQLENVLWKNRIYPRYSQKIQNLMADNHWAGNFQRIVLPSDTSQITAFQGFCQDLDKMKRPVLLVYEDIDRISEENKDQISKLLDISEKLEGHNVKVIYELNLAKMEEMGFDRPYIEKYIPYTMNLTNISGKKLIGKAVNKLKNGNGELREEDFDFLFRDVNPGVFLQKELGITWALSVTANIMPRQVNTYVAEVNMAMKVPEFAQKENRQTTAAFFFMKHFLYDIYKELAFEQELIEELQFTYKPEKAEDERRFTIMELAAQCRAGKGKNETQMEENGEAPQGLTERNVNRMFTAAKNEKETERNRAKLWLLLCLGYQMQYQQEALDSEAENEDSYPEGAGMRRIHRRLNQERETLENLEHNRKVSHLIRNLHMNGKSEYTDAEAVARVFIKDVLSQERNSWNAYWERFQNKLYWGEFLKDNTTVFCFGEDSFVALFRALWVYFSRCSVSEQEQEEILDKALDFYCTFGDAVDVLNFEKIVILNFFEIGSRRIFLKVLRYFNGLRITGNMNQEKIYYSFLKNYSRCAFQQGYLTQYDRFVFEMVRDKQGEADTKYLEKYLQECGENAGAQMERGNLPPQAAEELALVRDFYRRNAAMVKNPEKAKQKQLQIKFSPRTEPQYANEKKYRELEDAAADAKDADTYKNMLDQSYAKGEINLREYRELWDRFARQVAGGK